MADENAPADQPAEKPKRKPGQRGPDKKKRKRPNRARASDPMEEPVRRDPPPEPEEPPLSDSDDEDDDEPKKKKPKQKLEPEQAANLLDGLFVAADAIAPVVAWQIIKRRVKEFDEPAQKEAFNKAVMVMALTDEEKTILRPLLAAKLAEIEWDPDELLMLVIGSAYGIRLLALWTMPVENLVGSQVPPAKPPDANGAAPPRANGAAPPRANGAPPPRANGERQHREIVVKPEPRPPPPPKDDGPEEVEY